MNLVFIISKAGGHTCLHLSSDTVLALSKCKQLLTLSKHYLISLKTVINNT